MAASQIGTRLIVPVIVGVSICIGISWAWQSVSAYRSDQGFTTVSEAYASKQSDVMAEVYGRVVRLMMDDKDGGRNQRFVIETPGGQALLVSHHLVNSERIPLNIGDAVKVRGQYTWSEPGGTLQWTHHQSGSNRVRGWVEHKGERYD